MNAITKPPIAAPFRWAEPGDSRRLAELVNIAREGIPCHLWAEHAESGRHCLDVGADQISSEDALLSYRNALVVEQDNQVVGMVLGYPLQNNVIDPAAPALIKPFHELEQQALNTFYIHALAVLPPYRGHGWGGWLLTLAHRIAQSNGYQATSLGVFEQNEQAVQIYRRNGYRAVDRRPVVLHDCHPFGGDILLMQHRTM